MSIADQTPIASSGLRHSAWRLLVASSLLVLVAVAALLAVWWSATRETRTTSYRVLGDLASVRLDLGRADVEIDGGGGAVEVQRVDHFAFGHAASERRSVSSGRLSIVSHCPDQVLGACHTAYRLTVPDNIPLEIQTTSGSVRLAGVRASIHVSTHSGSVTTTGFCGFGLSVTSDSGNIATQVECSPDTLELRSGSGDVQATVPAGRYHIDAETDTGTRRVRGLVESEDSPFQIQVLSTTGDVNVESGT